MSTLTQHETSDTFSAELPVQECIRVKINVRFQKYLSKLLGLAEVPVELEERADVETLLDAMRSIPKLGKRLFKGKGLDYYYQLACNGSLLHGKADLKRPLTDGDEVYVFLTIGGG